MREITVFTHRRPRHGATLRLLAARAQGPACGCASTRRRAPSTTSPGPRRRARRRVKRDVELCVVLGGDGTILRALQSYAGTGVPVFAINFGEIGFLATVERQEAGDGIDRALRGDFELLRLPGIVVELDGERRTRSTTLLCTARSASASPSWPTRSSSFASGSAARATPATRETTTLDSGGTRQPSSENAPSKRCATSRPPTESALMTAPAGLPRNSSRARRR